MAAFGVGAAFAAFLAGILDFIHERKIGTEIFVTVATFVAVFDGETVAGKVVGGAASVNEAPITGESLPKEKKRRCGRVR